MEPLNGAENFFKSRGGRPKRRLRLIAFVQVVEKPQIRCLIENPLFTRVLGVFCIIKHGNHDISKSFRCVSIYLTAEPSCQTQVGERVEIS